VSARVLRRDALLGAVAVGAVAERLLFVSGPPGLNGFLCALAAVALLGWLVQRRGWRPSAESTTLVAAGLLFAALLTWRDAEVLRVFNMLAVFLLASLAAAHAGRAWLRRSTVSDLAGSALRTGLTYAAGPLGWIGTTAGEPERAASPWRRPAVAMLRGALLALPLLLLFGALLTSADPVFAGVVDDVFRLDFETLLPRAFFLSIVAWFTAGYMRAFVPREPLLETPLQVRGGRLAALEVTSALMLVNVLFLVFVLVQLRYLFGGAGMVEVTQGLTYAEYARRGFFELVAVAALVVALQLVAQWAVQAKDARERRMLQATSLLQVALLFVMMASAAWRMRLYVEAYGLTEDRIIASTFMAWLAFTLGWLALTVLRGRNDRFLAGALAAGFACLLLLNLMNPHALIMRVNGARVAAAAPADVAHAASLSADAVPALLPLLQALPAEQQCLALTALRRRLLDEHEDWRTWNLSRRRAQQALRDVVPQSACAAAIDSG